MHTVIVAKLNEMEMKGSHERIISTFYKDIGETQDEFESKITGYCCIYAPYYIHFLETDDEEFLNHVLNRVQETVGKRIHD